MAEAHDPAAYGAAIAGDYDAMYGDVLDTGGAVELLADLAGSGPVLELGVGTGRIAIPLAARGITVHGVDASPAMLERLRAKPGGDAVRAFVDDFTTFALDERFTLVVLAFNTIFALPDQDAQVAVFANAAHHLASGGRFVVEAWVPDLAAFRGGRAIRPRLVSGAQVSIEVATLDPVRQRMETTQIRFTSEGVHLFPADHRYAWPSELDLMARLAGLRRADRWADWRRAPFDAHSAAHVSVYERA